MQRANYEALYKKGEEGASTFKAYLVYWLDTVKRAKDEGSESLLAMA
jgi:hypothetical protein